jgi:hypothetical protein
MNIPEHIIHVYCLALKEKVPLRKGIFLGVDHKYNKSIKAAYMIDYYLTLRGQNYRITK